MKDKDFFKSLFDSFFNSGFNDKSFSSWSSFSISNQIGEDLSFPKEGDKNFHKVVETSENDTHITKKEIWTSIDGIQRFERTSSESKAKPNAIKSTKTELELQLKEAINKQEYEKACDIRDELKKLK